ncbi:MAG TPA: response regulator [Bacteroidota bacterium]|nr:response regulator [Bacteroidota bacterium]
MKFLVVDDSPTMRRIVNNSLKGLGYTDVIEAEDGKDALAKIEGIDFIITDWNMPVMTGLEFTKAVRSDDKYKHLPILMVTTRGVKDDIVEALQARVNNYVVKPFTPQVLKEKIDTIIKSISTQ